MLWTIAYNRPSHTWLSGGTPENYERPRDEIFQIEAPSRELAERWCRVRRVRQQRLTDLQRRLLRRLLAAPAAEAALLSTMFEIHADEVRAVVGLENKNIVADVAVHGRCARLTFDALNFLPIYSRIEGATACPA